MPVTSPDSIYYADTSTTDSVVAISAAEATSVQAALVARRAQVNFKWANAAARTAATGMSINDLGYQVDTNITYRYDGSAWKAWQSDWITATMTTSIVVGTGGSTLLQYKYVEGLVQIKGRITLGTAPTVGANATMNLPITVETPISPFFAYQGAANMYDVSVPANYDLTVGASSSSTTVVAFFTIASAVGVRGGVGPATPATWAVGDILSFNFLVTPA